MPEEPPPLEQIVSLPPPPKKSRFVELVFNIGRGQLITPPTEWLPKGYKFDAERAKRTPPNVLRFELWRAKEARLRVLTRGERLELVKVRYGIDEEPPPTPLPEPPACPPILPVYLTAPDTCSEDAEYFLAIAPIAAIVGGVAVMVDAVAYQAALDAALAAAPNTPATQYRRYFAELNRETQPMLIDKVVAGLSDDQKNKRKDYIDRTKSTLTSRVQERVKSMVPSVPAAYSMGDPVEKLSKLQLDLVDKHFPSGGAQQLTEFNEAFEMFANGELRFQLPTWNWTTQPSSGFYFFFAEFALLAIDMGIEAARWRALLRPLVRTQHIFARVYKPSGAAAAKLESYQPCNYDPLRIYAGSEKAALVATHPYTTDADTAQAQTDNVKQYLPGI